MHPTDAATLTPAALAADRGVEDCVATKSGGRGSVAVVIGFVLLAMVVLVPTALTYRNDAWREADTASIARHLVADGFEWSYPRIYWGGAGPGFVATEFPLYNLLVAGLYVVFGEHLWFGRAVSLAFACLSLVVFYRLASSMAGKEAGLWALAFFGLSPLTLRYGVAYMPEAMLLFFYVAALERLYRWSRGGGRGALYTAAVWVALAVLVKPTALLLGVVFAPIAFSRLRRGAAADLLAFAAISLLPAAAWYYHAHQIWLQYGNTFGILEGDTKFGGLVYWLSLGFYASIADHTAKWLFGGAGALMCLVGLAVSVRDRRQWVTVYGLAASGLYVFALGRATEKWYSIHYYIPCLPFVALAVGVGSAWLWRRDVRRGAARAVVAAAWISTVLVSAAFYRDRVHPRAAETAAVQVACAGEVARVVPPGARIVVSSPVSMVEAGRPRNYQEPTIFFYSGRYGWSLPLEWHTGAKLDELRHEGAGYFVIYSAAAYASNTELARYLESSAEQVGPGLEAACGIYRFK